VSEVNEIFNFALDDEIQIVHVVSLFLKHLLRNVGLLLNVDT
jgi:hypothetical protein